MIEARELQVVNVRLVKEPSLYSPEPVTSPEDVLRVIANELATYDREVFAMLNLFRQSNLRSRWIASMDDLPAINPKWFSDTCTLLLSLNSIVVSHTFIVWLSNCIPR